MSQEFKVAEIGQSVGFGQLQSLLNESRSGTFFCIKGYVNRFGEKADHWLQYGINYGRIKDKDIAKLRSILAGGMTDTLTVKHGIWADPAMLAAITAHTPTPDATMVEVSYDDTIGSGDDARAIKVKKIGWAVLSQFSNRKGKGRVYATVSYTLQSDDERVAEAVRLVLHGLENPSPSSVEYEKEAKGLYSLPNRDAEGYPLDDNGNRLTDDAGNVLPPDKRIYIRDCLTVSKVVRVEGDYGQSAKSPEVAIRDAVKDSLTVSRYRQYKLHEGNFEAITIEGQSIMVDGVEGEIFIALPEHVKAALVEA